MNSELKVGLKNGKNTPTKIIFLGNTKYSIIGAQILNKAYPIMLFVTIPDRPTGRDKKLTPSPVKLLAQQLNTPFLETSKLDEATIQEIASLSPDFLVVEDYRLILPEALLKVPKIAPLNIHHSLLPKYRGPSPAPSAILAGEKISGVSIIKMGEKVDAGEILAQTKYELKPNETTDSLLTQLNKLGGELVAKVTGEYLKGTVKPIPQNLSQVTYTHMLKKEDGYFDISNPPTPEILDRMIRAFYPWPNAWTKWSFGKAQDKKERVVKFLPEGLVQMEGKKVVKLEEFLRGYPNFPIKDF